MNDFFEEIEWSPTIGDPSLMGWFTVFCYFACFLVCFNVARNGRDLFSILVARQTTLWWSIAILMFLLGVNKQLDLQSFFTAALRHLSIEQGWYEHRREYQRLFILFIAGAGFTGMIATAYLFHKVLKTNLIAIIGLSVLVVFILIRASSFHHMDQFIGVRFLGLYMNWVLELSGIGLVALNATYLLRRRKNPKQSRMQRAST